MLVLWLPKEKIVVTADLYTATPPNAPAANPPPISAVVMMANFDRLGLNFDTMVSVHAPTPDVPITRASVLAALGRAQ